MPSDLPAFLAFLLLVLVLLLLALVLPLSALVLQTEGNSLTRSIQNYGIVIPETIHASNQPSSHHGTVCIQSRLLYITLLPRTYQLPLYARYSCIYAPHSNL